MKDLTDKGIGLVLNDGQTLFSFLGSFWHHVYEDPDFVERFCKSLGLLSAQLEQQKNEARAASGRTIMPVFARKRWFCVKLSRETANMCNESKIRLEQNAPIIGPQPYISPIRGRVPTIGFGGYPDDLVFYPLHAPVVSAVSLHERADDPEISLISGQDFVISGDAIVFKSDVDPLSGNLFRESPDGDGVVVWLKDAMIDNNYVDDYAGYAVKMYLPSSEDNMNIVNAFWDAVNTGATVSNITKFVCAVLGLKDADDIVKISEGRKVVDQGVLLLPRGFFSDNLDSGLGFSYLFSPVEVVGTDANGNPKLKFDVVGSERDVNLFFEGCWARCERDNVNMADLLGVDLSQPAPVVSPRQFMLDNLIGSNIVTISINMSRLSEAAISRLWLLGRAIDVFPVGACLQFLLSAGKISEQYNSGKMSEDGIVAPMIEPNYPNDVLNRSESIRIFVIPGKEENNP